MGFIVVLLTTAAAWSHVATASPFDGTWRADPSATKFDSRPEYLLLRDGLYHCFACTPPVHIRADGQPHATPGRDYVDAMSATIVDERTMKVAQFKKGRMVSEFTRTLSADGNLMTTVIRTSIGDKGGAKFRTSRLKRVGPAPAGSYAQSGSWSPVVPKANASADDGLVIRLKSSGDQLTFQSGDAETYTARFGGTKVAVANDPSGSVVSVRRTADNAFEEATYRSGKLSTVDTYTLSSPMTLTVVSRDVRGGYTDTFVFHRF